MSYANRLVGPLVLLSVAACSAGHGASDDANARALTTALSASQRAGMGATLYSGGVTFRIWAPYASRIWVAGDFNGWSTTANELGNEFNGNFSGDVSGAARWQSYKYFIQGQDGSTFWRADPRAARM